MAIIVHPLPRDMRHPADYRDEIEHWEVARVLSELAEDHPARVAYDSGAISDSIALTHRLASRKDLVERLVAAYLGHNDRIWANYLGVSSLAQQR
jgi:hypothetical protein